MRIHILTLVFLNIIEDVTYRISDKTDYEITDEMVVGDTA